MNRRCRFECTALLLFFAVAIFPVTRAVGQYQISWSTIGGGGGVTSGGPYTLTGTIGQPDAGEMAGGDYEVLGGFWSGGPLCTVDFEHFARFANFWLDTGAGLPADLYEDNIINGLDLNEFVSYWLCYCPLDWPLR